MRDESGGHVSRPAIASSITIFFGTPTPASLAQAVYRGNDLPPDEETVSTPAQTPAGFNLRAVADIGRACRHRCPYRA